MVARPPGTGPATQPLAEAEDTGVADTTAAAWPASAVPVDDPTPTDQRTDDIITSARDKLEAIDRILKDDIP